MTVTVSSFRADFPEFASIVTYPDAMVAFWLTTAAKLLSIDRWAELLDLGTELFIAHNLALGARDQKAAVAGGIGGSSAGLVASKAVDKVSVSYDTGAAAIEGAGAWNLTTYGTRYIQLARMIGAGGLQL
ncbi:DUF4054 domain-containing protein [Kaistia dalseonensis]|uniref:DUF4054 domain-containing protein n=1 Tax=Kaistia dalseonensis TaxID=410840 RepID=A0ABU0H6M0_9HYPH|nr:DUF4054 domain-containing protein [Kaistia dalseonensis]MCX5495375.1 DUF4054 domain-containing protein [Kaistia dalseonensis]MDQ0437962.1 hypothetical protein [Kaistia dalseonensis]